MNIGELAEEAGGPILLEVERDALRARVAALEAELNRLRADLRVVEKECRDAARSPIHRAFPPFENAAPTAFEVCADAIRAALAPKEEGKPC